MNNEAKVRRSTKLVVLGKAKVMSYEEIEEARAKRLRRSLQKGKGKGKCGRKCKNLELEAGEAEPESEVEKDLEVARAVKDVKKGNR
ncbi:hypothetical protein ACEPPN_012257 [Leptodophora sp. 'Broadleaf-Isolate-01']